MKTAQDALTNRALGGE